MSTWLFSEWRRSQRLISTILRAGRLLAPSMPVSSSTCPAGRSAAGRRRSCAIGAQGSDAASRRLLGDPAHQLAPQRVGGIASLLVFLRRHVGHVGPPRPPRGDDGGFLLTGGDRTGSGLGWLSLQGFVFRTIAGRLGIGSTVSDTACFRFGVTTAGPASGTAFRFLAGRL
jgi:hypothetical protein